MTAGLSVCAADKYWVGGAAGIAVDFASWPKVGTVVVCPAAGFPAEAAQSSVSVTVGGEPFGSAEGSVENGNVVLRLLMGRKAIIR